MTDEEKVKAKRPGAIACELVFSSRRAMMYRIEAGYAKISNLFYTEDEAWADAARKLDGGK